MKDLFQINSKSSSSLQIGFDLTSVLAIVSLKFLVELAISLIDVVDIFLFHEHASTRELASLGDLLFDFFGHSLQSFVFGYFFWGLVFQFFRSFGVSAVQAVIVEDVPAEGFGFGALGFWPDTWFVSLDSAFEKVALGVWVDAKLSNLFFN